MFVSRVIAGMAGACALRVVLAPLLPVETLVREVHSVGTYLGVVGGVYSIIVAFVIYVVWEQYNRVQTGLDREASAVEDLVTSASMLTDRGAAANVRSAATRYLETVIGDEARRLAVGERSSIAQELAAALAAAVRATPVTGEKDDTVYDEMLRDLARVADARQDRLAVSSTRIPGTLWSLVMFASGALLSGFYVLGFRSLVLSCIVVAAVAGTLVYVLSVVKDMDNPFHGAWNVSFVSVKAALARMQTR